jgi:uncharacterized membrane protein (TIGR02234 family)
MTMTGSQMKSRTLLFVAACAIVVMVAWSQTWSTLSLASGVAGDTPVPVTGQTMAPGLSALALTSIALVAALALAGRVFRIVLGAVQCVLGVVISITSIGVIGDPVAAAAPALISITGLQDVSAIRDIVSQQALTAWPFVSVVVGILTALTGVVILVFSKKWPQSGRKYAAASTPVSPLTAPLVTPLTTKDVDASHAKIDAWDDLSRGGDPTS